MKLSKIVCLLVVLLVLGALPAVAMAAPAAGDTPPDPTSLMSWLTWLVAGGAGTIATMLASELAEHWPWFQRLPGTAKRWSMIAVSGAIALGAWSVLTFVPQEVLAQLAIPFAVAMTGILSYLAGQVYHKTTKDEPHIYTDSAPLERVGPQTLRR